MEADIKLEACANVHKILFWLSKTDIENYFVEINKSLQDCGYEVLPALMYSQQGIFTDKDLIYLEENGFIQKCSSDIVQEETSTMTEVYNQMQKSKNKYDPLRHVFTTELGKFSIRH